MHHQNLPSLLSRITLRAREMRKQPTPSEARLWSLLRMSRLGVRFRRQHPLTPYVVDFYCAARRLVVEVDGEYHLTEEQRTSDAHRTAELVRLHGVRVLRVDAQLVLTAPTSVVAIIRAAL